MKKHIIIAAAAIAAAMVLFAAGIAGTQHGSSESLNDTLDDILARTQALDLQVGDYVTAALLPSPTPEPPPPAPEDLSPLPGGSNLIFATGVESGSYYSYGSELARRVTRLTDTTVAAVVSNGSRANIEMLDMGEAQLGFTQADIMVSLYTGNGVYASDYAVTSFSVVAAMYLEPVQIVTLDSGLGSVADLAGHRVAVGTKGSGLYTNTIAILAACGLTEDDIDPVYQSFAESAEELQSGDIDAAFALMGAPYADIAALAEDGGVYLLGLDEACVAALEEEYPWYHSCVITAGTYGLENDVSTVAVAAVVIADNSVSDDDVYNFLYGVFASRDTLKNPQAASLDLPFATSVQGVPYHPGAIRFYADLGIATDTAD